MSIPVMLEVIAVRSDTVDTGGDAVGLNEKVCSIVGLIPVFSYMCQVSPHSGIVIRIHLKASIPLVEDCDGAIDVYLHVRILGEHSAAPSARPDGITDEE